MYNDLKAAIGKTEADQQIQTFMKGQYKKRMDEINRMYPKAARPSSGRANRDSAAKDRSKQKRREEEKKNEEVNAQDFTTGFDHGFENMATFNGQSVG